MNTNQSEWIILPGGFSAINRNPLPSVPDGARIATFAEFNSAMYGAPFTWGFLPSTDMAQATSPLWKKYRIGYGGLFHKKWFMCQEGRVGGAENVITTLPGSLRHTTMLHGGPQVYQLADNEGYAVVIPTTEADQQMFRQVQLRAIERVTADAGNIIVSPIRTDGVINIGMTGRCLWCPNRELITFRQMQDGLPKLKFELWEEYKS